MANKEKEKAITEPITEPITRPITCSGKMMTRPQKKTGKEAKRNEAQIQAKLIDAERRQIREIDNTKWKKLHYSALMDEERDRLEKLESKIQELSNKIETKVEKIKSIKADKKVSFPEIIDANYHIVKSRLRRKRLSGNLVNLMTQWEKSSKRILDYRALLSGFITSDYVIPEDMPAQPGLALKPSLPCLSGGTITVSSRNRKRVCARGETATRNEIMDDTDLSTNQSVDVHLQQNGAEAYCSQENESNTHSSIMSVNDDCRFEQELDEVFKQEISIVGSIKTRKHFK